MNGAVSVHELGIRLHLFAAHAIFRLVILFVDIAILLTATPEFLGGAFVMRICRAHIVQHALVKAEYLD